jgi:hypothetical protein
MSKHFFLIFSIILFVSTTYLKAETIMDKREFYEFLKEKGLENKEMTIKFSGNEVQAVSKEKYVFFEVVKFIGEEDIKSSHFTPWHPEETFFILYNDVKVEVDFRDIRTYIEETYKQLYTKKDVSKAPEFVRDDLKERPQVLVCEYGLQSGKIYYAKFNTDHFYVNGPDGPKQRTNIVIWISDKPFKDGKPQMPLTPMYSGWSY